MDYGFFPELRASYLEVSSFIIPWPYQAGRYWAPLAPFLCHAARVPEKLNDGSGSAQTLNGLPVVKPSAQNF